MAEACSEKQAKYLRDLGGDPDGMTKQEAKLAIDRILKKGGGSKAGGKGKVGPGPITAAQAKVLEKYGKNPAGMTKAQASAAIQAIADNGWKLPTFDAEPAGLETEDDIPTFE